MPISSPVLCLRDWRLLTRLPCRVYCPGKPGENTPGTYIDPDTCIDCGACIAECPWNAIFIEDEVPSKYVAKGGEYLSQPVGTPGFTTIYDGVNHEGEPVHLEATRILEPGEIVDLTPDIPVNAEFFTDGPGYSAA